MAPEGWLDTSYSRVDPNPNKSRKWSVVYPEIYLADVGQPSCLYADGFERWKCPNTGKAEPCTESDNGCVYSLLIDACEDVEMHVDLLMSTYTLQGVWKEDGDRTTLVPFINPLMEWQRGRGVENARIANRTTGDEGARSE